jgi:hypothetical protein
MNDDTPNLNRATKATAYLRQLAKKPMVRPPGSHSGAFLRAAGLTDDEVMTPDKKRMTAQEARATLGPGWYLSTVFTGRERVTALGRAELAKLKKRD